MSASTRVLIVDDSTMAADVLRKILRELGLENVDSATSGNQGWEKVKEAADSGSPYQLILCDWQMPDGNGIELVQKIRAEQRFVKTFICMVTAESEAQNIVNAITVGINSFVIKPFTKDDLAKKIRPFVNSK